MRSTTTIRATGNTAEADLHRRTQLRSIDEHEFFGSEDIGIRQTTRGIQIYLKRRRAAGIAGWRWAAAGRIYDPTLSYTGDNQGGEVVWVDIANPAVVNGYVDPDSGETVYSVPGLWIALQGVNPVVNPATLPAGTYYHIPQWPMPTPANIEDHLNYWLLISPYNLCT